MSTLLEICTARKGPHARRRKVTGSLGCAGRGWDYDQKRSCDRLFGSLIIIRTYGSKGVRSRSIIPSVQTLIFLFYFLSDHSFS